MKHSLSLVMENSAGTLFMSQSVRANIAAATIDVDDKSYEKVYNVGSGKNYSVNQIAE